MSMCVQLNKIIYKLNNGQHNRHIFNNISGGFERENRVGKIATGCIFFEQQVSRLIDKHFSLSVIIFFFLVCIFVFHKIIQKYRLIIQTLDLDRISF